MHDHIRSFDGHPELAVCWALRSSRLSNGSVMAWTGHAEWRQTTVDDESVAAGAGAGAGAASGASGASGGVATHGVLQLHHAHTLFIGDSARLGLTKSSYTVEAWVKLSKYNTTGGQHDQTILASDTLHVGSCLHVIIRDGHPYLGHYCHDTSTGYRVPLHRWVHLAFVYDADSREQIVYADGERIGGEAGRPPLDRGVPLHIGRYAGACACLVIGLRARACVCAWRTVVGAHVWVCIHCLQVADLCSATCLSCECGGAQGRRRTLLRRCMITFVRSMGTRSWLYAGHCGHRGCQTVQ